MTQRNIQGMRLRRAENSRDKKNGWLLQMLVAMMSSLTWMILCCALIGFEEIYETAVMLAVGSYLCLMYGLLLRWKKSDWFFYCVLVVLLILVLVCRNQILEGYRLFWSRLSDAKVRGTGWILPEWKLQLPEEQRRLCLTLFLGIAAGGISLVVCMLTALLPQLLAVTIPAAALVGMAVLGAQLSAGCQLLVLTVPVLVLMYSGWHRGHVLAPVAVSWIQGGLAVTLLVAVISLPLLNGWTDQVSRWTQQRMHDTKYETEHTILPEGDFTDYTETEKRAEVALIVTMDNPEMMYLRGYTGSVFEENQWKPIEKELLVKNKNLLYWLNLNAFRPDVQFSVASGETERSVNTVTIQNMGACSLYRYVPFSLLDDGSLPAENLNTDGCTVEGQRVYTYSMVSGGAEAVSQTLQQLQRSNEKTVLQYRKAESAYRHFVYNFYLQVPEDARQLLQENWDTIAASYGGASSLTLQQAQECTLRFLGKAFPENGTPDDLELPLDIARGTTYQYATVAALTMRYFGIPARYAEGYLITSQMAASARSGAPLTVDSSCARGWVEVYQDGLGWIPMDLTPGLGEMVQENPEDSSDRDGDIENEDLEPEEAEEDSPMETETEIPDPEGGSVVRVMTKMMTGLLKLLLVLAVLFLLLWFRRKIVNRNREKRFRDKNRKDAVAWVFADTVQLLEKLGFDRGNGSMRHLCEPVGERLGQEYAGQLLEMICLNVRALFSSRAMEETEWEWALRFRNLTIQNVKTQVKWYRRLWLKWVRCLY